jgi:hypothetical protein
MIGAISVVEPDQWPSLLAVFQTHLFMFFGTLIACLYAVHVLHRGGGRDGE